MSEPKTYARIEELPGWVLALGFWTGTVLLLAGETYALVIDSWLFAIAYAAVVVAGELWVMHLIAPRSPTRLLDE